ncbi:hypothetical protein PR202_ga09893 [Eleusine coracana subsp. coracana]|uniref:C2 NT-type domain-containing protein n=1 Tax=Eleusine coracana subsp. coracana TaxID=191504 RepID=A0AAV5C3X3_ELECO|nr:hypothetical protein PR202_ga09893 [Eleusine coracana subsp. coracana]
MSSRPSPSGDAGDAAFARDIAMLNRALSFDHSEQTRHKPRLKLNSSSSSFRKLLPSSTTTSSSSSSSSFWKTAISYLGRRRLDCAFTLHVHSVDGLPAPLDGAPVSVQFRRPPASASARPVAAAHGAAAFEEALTLRAPVHFSRGARARAAVRYEPRHFTVSVFAAALDLGRHEVDLARLLPLSFRDLEDGAGSGFGKWTTSFRLACGARLNATFSCALVGEQHNGREVARPVLTSDYEDEGSPEAKHCTSVEVKKGDLVHSEYDSDSVEFDIVEHGVEYATDGPKGFKHVVLSNVADQAVQVEFEELFCSEYEAVELKTDENVIDVAVQWEIVRDGQDGTVESASVPTTTTPEAEGQLLADKELEDLESMFSYLSFVELGHEEFESPTTGEPDDTYKFGTRKGRSRSMDASSDYVAREFLDMLGIEHSPGGQPWGDDSGSPRERLWKQFEKEALASGNTILGLDFDDETKEPAICEDVVEDFDLSVIIHEAELELQNTNQHMDTRFQAKWLEDDGTVPAGGGKVQLACSG